ncbi:MAG: hypothetical protein AAFY76_00460 [Cyanobacteria bacterium J06649_11]
MDSIVDFVNSIRERTSMYLGAKSLRLLCVFIEGWIWGVGFENIKDGNLLGQFSKWLRENHNVADKSNWYKMLIEISKNEADALDNFFITWDKFLLEKCPLNNCKNLSQEA